MTEKTEPVDPENFAIDLTDKCQTHEQWLTVMRFGLGTLLKNQPLLMECIVRESDREAHRFNKKCGAATHVPADHARTIMQELGLRFEMTPQ